MRKLTRFKPKVPRFRPKVPRPKPKVPRSRPKLPRSTLSTLSTLKTLTPPRSQNRHAPPRVLSSCVVVSQKSPRRGERFSRPKRSVLAASSKIQLGARIAEAKRRPREAQLPPRKRLIVRGVVPATTQSDLPPMRATARLAPQGQCPNLGGDARRRRKTERISPER